MCESFTPAGDDAEDEALDTYIEERRIAFREEWYQYTSEDFGWAALIFLIIMLI